MIGNMNNKNQNNNNHKITINFTYLFLLFATISLIAAKYNHIDDTDETYGYFEPLHYLLTKQGFQTWEYSPNFGIRSYAYLSPFWLLSTIFIKFTSLLFGDNYIASNKLILFYYIKIILGLFTAYSETKFITTIEKKSGKLSSYLTCILIISSPGIFYSSTSFLPSASAMSLFMLATSAYLESSFITCVFWGCICVCWLGWPFVAVLFVPLGLHMLIVEYYSPKYNQNCIISVIYLILQVVLVFIIVTIPSYLIDCYMYHNWNSPPINILLYNAIGGSGDELYGIEPAMYYIKNLALNIGISWPLTLITPFILLISFSNYKIMKTTNSLLWIDISRFIVYLSAFIWLIMLFLRPHKEERFMYPIYPILCFMGSNSLLYCLDILNYFVSIIYKGSYIIIINEDNKSFSKKIIILLLKFIIIINLFFGISRIISNFNNFGGYNKLWINLKNQIDIDNEELYKNNNILIQPNYITKYDINIEGRKQIVVCTGGEWYFFPSHFFLPSYSSLEYIKDNFHGQLPQHFSYNNGTFGLPIQSFNGDNREEMERYVDISSCDYIVALIQPLSNDNRPLLDYINNSNYVETYHEKVIDSVHSLHPIARALYIPYYSNKYNKYNKYSIYKRNL